MNSAAAIVAALLILVALVAYEVKRAIDAKAHWESGEHDWSKK